jgi:hypothetical protein
VGLAVDPVVVLLEAAAPVRPVERRARTSRIRRVRLAAVALAV